MIFFAVNIFLSLLAAWGIPIQSDSGLEKGNIIGRVICQNSPFQSYALYLPQEYTPENHGRSFMLLIHLPGEKSL